MLTIDATVRRRHWTSSSISRDRPGASRPDSRWSALAKAISILAEQRRRSIRIVDADCGDGALLMGAVRLARRLGFTAIEARGLGQPGPLLTRARAAARRLRDPAIGVTFDAADLLQALGEEAELPADIVLWRDEAAPGRDREAVFRALGLAGQLVIGTPEPIKRAIAA